MTCSKKLWPYLVIEIYAAGANYPRKIALFVKSYFIPHDNDIIFDNYVFFIPKNLTIIRKVKFVIDIENKQDFLITQTLPIYKVASPLISVTRQLFHKSATDLIMHIWLHLELNIYYNT